MKENERKFARLNSLLRALHRLLLPFGIRPGLFNSLLKGEKIRFSPVSSLACRLWSPLTFDQDRLCSRLALLFEKAGASVILKRFENKVDSSDTE
jgi:hypothetical protein